MSNSIFLYEPHSFRVNDKVTVYDRITNEKIGNGEIFMIINDKIGYNSHQYIDYFYIKFHPDIYHRLLSKGYKVIHNRIRKTIGNIVRNPEDNKIQKIYRQEDFPCVSSYEYEINFEEIDAILIWKVAFRIEECKLSYENLYPPYPPFD